MSSLLAMRRETVPGLMVRSGFVSLRLFESSGVQFGRTSTPGQTASAQMKINTLFVHPEITGLRTEAPPHVGSQLMTGCEKRHAAPG